MKNAAQILLQRARGTISRLSGEDRGVAAVEFALILPLMLTIYLGTSEISLAVIASRDVELVARAVADLVSQQPSGTYLDDTQMTPIWSAANAIMSPYPTTTLKMTVTSIKFVTGGVTADANGGSSKYDAKVQWSILGPNGGALRPCNTTLTPVANGSGYAATAVPVGLYVATTLIASDVAYQYTPTFGNALFTGLPSALNMNSTIFMKPRASDVLYTGTAGTKCNPAP